jgi:hypothetical protein
LRRITFLCALLAGACGGRVPETEPQPWSTGGATGSGGTRGTGGATGSGGAMGTSGATGSGGAIGSGGATGSGGAPWPGTGGSSGVGADPGGSAGSSMTPFCVPGLVTECKCDDGRIGKQACASDGSAFSPCKCPTPFPSCKDGTLNGSETDIDCGGPDCPPCEDEQLCRADADCRSKHCSAGICGVTCVQNGTCKPCSDGVQDGIETDVDCGGAECLPCDPGKSCKTASDCSSRVCVNSRCAKPTCSDFIKNGDEVDIDCGGSFCPSCSGCSCKINSDCASGSCVDCTCRSATCSDKVKNGSETDVDCGGGTCPLCSPGSRCKSDLDCTTGWCTGTVCAFADCLDAVKNGNETDVDCGGRCVGCGLGRSCLVDGDCISKHCLDGTCSAT